jgi:hypothetical protein
LAVSLVAAVGLAAFQDARPREITLEWDRNPEPDVRGYFVYIGRRSGDRGERVDVGNNTRFTYRSRDAGRYFFAVAAYAAGTLVGPVSSEVSARLGSGIPDVPEPPEEIDPLPLVMSRSSQGGLTSTSCEISDPVEGCAAVLARFDRAPTSVTVAQVGIFAIVDERIIRLHTSGAQRRDVVALTATSSSIRYTQVIVDPAFETTRFVLVGMVEDSHAGRMFSIVRYRELDGALGEPATLVTDVPAFGESHPVFTVDGNGVLYVAMPGEPGADLYAGRILRFARDGSVPDDNRARSPVIAEGYVVPLALSSDGRTLWIVGKSTGGAARAGEVTLQGVGQRAWPEPLEDGLLPVAVTRAAFGEVIDRSRSAAPATTYALVVDVDGRLHRIALAGSVRKVETVASPHAATAVSIANGGSAALFRLSSGAYAIVSRTR